MIGGGAGSGYPKEAAEKLIQDRKNKINGGKRREVEAVR